MNLIAVVRKVLNSTLESTKNMKTNRSQDVFSEVDFTCDLASLNYGGKPRQKGEFTFQYLLSPKPSPVNKSPCITYDEIITTLQNKLAINLKDAGIICISVNYGNSTIITDSTTGSVSLTFGINITVTERQK